jgi:hypothetical protein
MDKIFTLLSKKGLAVASLIVIHILLIFSVFERQIFDPFNSVLNGQFDGEKNNFTYLSYVKEEIGSEGIFKYNTFNYPYGEYVYSADNTPLLAIPLRWFCHNVYDISDYAMPLYNYFIIGNFLICALLSFSIFRRTISHQGLSWLAAVFLPWTNIQVLRFFVGHYNLSLSSILLAMILLCMLWVKVQSVKRYVVLLLAMVALIFCSFLLHGYYLAINLAFMSAFMFFYGIRRFKSPFGKRSIIASIALPLLTGGLVYLTMINTDGFLHLRDSRAGGYDWWELKANFSLLYTHYEYHNFFFPVWIDKKVTNNESQIYLGNIGLYLTFIFLIVALVNARLRYSLAGVQMIFLKQPLTGALLGSGFLLLSMSLGEYIRIIDDPTRVTWPMRINTPSFEILIVTGGGLLICISVLQAILKRRSVNAFPESIEASKKQTVLFYVCAAIVVFFMVGRYTNLLQSYHNVTNPLLWLHTVTDLVEQFRALSRFLWPFYWVFYIWVFFTTAKLFVVTGKYFRNAIVVLIIVCGSTELMDTTRTMKPGLTWTNIGSARSMAELDDIRIDYKKYQAILPFPYYHVGSENGNLTIDDIDEWSRYTYRLALKSSLPLMSNKVSRTPPVFAQSLLNMITTGVPSPALKQRLTEKPILVAVARTISVERLEQVVPVADSAARPIAFHAFREGMKFAQKKALPLVDSTRDAYFYEWRVE